MFEFLNIFGGVFFSMFPYSILCLVPFWGGAANLRGSKKRAYIYFLLFTAYLLGESIVIFVAGLALGTTTHILTVVKLILSFALLFSIIKARLMKLLYVFLVVAVYATCLSSMASHFEAVFFPEYHQLYNQITHNLFHFTLMIVTIPFVWRFFRSQMRVFVGGEHRHLWKVMWLIPAAALAVISIFTASYDVEVIAGRPFFFRVLLLSLASFLLNYAVIRSVNTSVQKQWKKLRFPVFSFLLFLAISLIASVAYILSARQINRTYASQQLVVSGETIKLSLATAINSELSLIRKLGDSPIIRDYFTQPGDPVHTAYAVSEFELFQQHSSEGIVFWVNDIDKMFHATGTEPYLVDPDDPENYWYNLTLYETDDYNFNINYNPEMDMINLWINVPVFSYSAGGARTPVGMLGTGLNLTAITELVDAAHRERSRYITAYLFNRHHEITIAADFDLITHKVLLSEHLGGAGEEAIRVADSIVDGKGQNYIYGDYMYRVGVIPSIKDWNIVMSYPLPGLLALNQDMNVVFFGMLSLILILFVIMNIFVARSSRAMSEQNLRLEESNRNAAEANDILKTVNDAAALLLQAGVDGFMDVLWRCMGMIGQTVSADRVYIWRNRTENGVVYSTQLLEWSMGAEPQQGNEYTIDIPLEETSEEWVETLTSKRCVNAIVREMTQGSQEQLSPQGILSIFAAPIFFGDYFWGFVGFDNCHSEKVLPKHLEESLYSAGLLIGNAFKNIDDITATINLQAELKEALEEAQAANAAKSKFLAAMSHEIRTPMNAIMGIAQTELQKDTLPDEYVTALNRIHNSGGSLLGIINDILDMSKIETGKMELHPVEYDIPSLINDTVQLNIVRIGSKQIKLILDIEETLPSRMIGDELRLKQILSNLLSNAIKYTDKGYVKLTVSFSEQDSGLTLRFVVEDTGQGMRPEDRDRLFTEYSRFNTESNRATEGTGIGLSITKSLTELMDGTIEVESEYGIGSVFAVTVRQTAVDCEPIGPELAERLRSFTFTGERQAARLQINRERMPYGKVLIVDDVETNLYVAEGLMTPYELKIETALSGFEALDKIRNGAVYDIIFMDHMMPQMDGIETTQHLRDSGYTNPIVALTANAITGQADHFLANGFDDFISKPIDLRQLNATLNRFIRDRQPPAILAAAGQQKEKAQRPSKKDLHPIFVRDAKKAMPILERIYQGIEDEAEDDLRLFAVNAHGMKSALASIGEREASQLAGILEDAAKKKNKAVVQAETPALLDSLRSAVAKIEAETPAEASAANDDLTVLRKHLATIAAACAEYDDQAAEAALAELAKHLWTKETKEVLDKISEHLLHSDFEKAAEAAESRLSDNPDSFALLQTVDGLDADDALAAMGGLRDIYLNTVKLTARLLPETIWKMDNYAAAGGVKEFAIEIHGLKSVLKNIGASALGREAERLETDARGGKVSVEAYQSFKDSLTELLRKLNLAIRSEKPESKVIDGGAFAEALTEAQTAAGEFDCILALELLYPFAGGSLGGETETLLEGAIHALEAFDCEDALKYMKKLEDYIHDRTGQ